MIYPTELNFLSQRKRQPKLYSRNYTILPISEALVFVPTEPYTVACIVHTSTLLTLLWYPSCNNKTETCLVGASVV